MKNYCLFMVFVLTFLACSEDEESISQPDLEIFHVNLRIDSSTILLNEDNFDIAKGDEVSGCMDDFVYGMRYTDMVSKTQMDNLVESFQLGINRKVHITDLGAPKKIAPGVYRSFEADSLRYMSETLYDISYRDTNAVILPFNEANSLIVRDSINNAILPETFIIIRMQNEELRSFAEYLSERSEGSYFRINSILKLSRIATREYTYVVEGDFKVDMYSVEQKTPVIIEGDFRLPLYTYYTNEALERCE